jgi:hypothetical protein
MHSSIFDFCIPTRATAVPDGHDWLHEVKYDGYLTKAGARWGPRPANHARRLQLDRPLSVDPRGGAEEQAEAVRR